MAAQVPQDERETGMVADISPETHPLEIPESLNSGYFDDITYTKGASLLFMIEAYMGEKALMAGLNRYLNKYQLDNAVTANLWEALGNGAADIWGPWTKNSGHPYVFVNETEGGIHLKQVRKTGNASDVGNEVIYTIPLFLQTAKGVDGSVLFKKREDDVALGDDMDFFFLNADGQGLYRVGYTPWRLKKLATQTDKLSTGGIVGLVSDTYQIAREGSLGVDNFMTVSKGVMENDERYWPWYQVYESLGSVRGAWQGDKAIYNAINQFNLNRTLARIDRMGWPDDYWNLAGVTKDLDIRFRAKTLAEAALAGDKTAIKGGRSIFKTFIENGKKAANGNLWEIGSTIAVMYGGEEEVSLEQF
jgi:hypothetical protein